MDADTLAHVAQLSDGDLVAQVTILAQNERDATVALIVHLAELDQRRLFLAEGYSSLFSYCVGALHLSESAAYGRIEAARVVRRFPILLRHLCDGSVNLTTVGLLAPHLTIDNHEQVLAMARHRSRRETEELVARLRPRPPVPDTIRKLPTRTESPSEAPEPPLPMEAMVSAEPEPSAPPTTVARRSAVVAPLAPARYKIQFTASAALHAKLRQVQALLRHQIPSGDLEQIFDRALGALHQDLIKQKIAATDRPREQQAPDGPSRHVPAAVRRAVWQRDGGRCAFVARNGRRCTEDAFLEFHHVVPYANGGLATVGNIEVRCRAHNGYEAERDFGWHLGSTVREEGRRYARGLTLGRFVGLLRES